MRMMAWVVNDYQDKKASWENIEAPIAAEGEALVRVHAAGVNFADGLMMAGRYQVRPPTPFIPGVECAGLVMNAPASSEFKRGDRVAFQTWGGGYAEYCAVPVQNLLRVPQDMALEEAASLLVSYTTARVALLDRASLRAKESLLVLGAGGALGLACVQLGFALGADVIAAAGSEAKRQLALENGAAAAVDYRSPDFVDAVRTLCPEGVDIIADPVGGDATLAGIDLLAWRGRILLLGFASGVIPLIPAQKLLGKCASACGVYWSPEKDGKSVRKIQRELLDRWARGEISPRIYKRFDLSDFPTALGLVESGSSQGKIVLNVGNYD